MQNTNLARQKEFFVPIEKLMEYDEFTTFAEFKHADTFGIIDFVQYLYNLNSPLAQNEDLQNKVYKAYELAGLNLNATYAQHLLDVGDSQVMIIDGVAAGDSEFYMAIDNMIACYLSRVQNNLKWELYVTYLSLYWQYTKRLRTPISMLLDDDKALKGMDTKTKITEPAFDLIKKLDMIKKDIFGDYKVIADVAEKKLRKVSPETWATKPNSR